VAGTAQRPSQKTKRLLFIDMFRGLVTLIMMEGHVSNSTILTSLRPTKGFHYLDLLNGMVAPSFIFIAGFAFGLALDKKWDDFLALRKPFWQQLRRLLFILGVAYWLHLPTWSLRAMLKLDSRSIQYFLRCDVLHLIALSLIMVLLLAVLVRSKTVFMILLPLLTLLNVFATPYLYVIELRNYMPDFIADYLTDRHGALFPIFPWAAYTFLGTFSCWAYLRLRAVNQEGRLFRVLAVGGLLMFIGGFALFYAPWQYHSYVDASRSSPRHFMLKMGFVYMTLALYYFYEQIRKPTSSWLNVVGQESLFVYALHLVIVYGASFMPTYVAKAVGPSLTYGPSFLISFLVISSMAVAGIAWHMLKVGRPALAKRIFYATAAIYFIRFLLWPY
jgi:uncharacterized membrane protein